MKLRDCAKLIRSKNAGPFLLTFDIMFSDLQTYIQVRDHNVVTARLFSNLFGTPLGDVHIVAYDAALAIKATIPRSAFSGDLDDTDVFGGQQYAPLLDLEVPEFGLDSSLPLRESPR